MGLGSRRRPLRLPAPRACRRRPEGHRRPRRLVRPANRPGPAATADQQHGSDAAARHPYRTCRPAGFPCARRGLGGLARPPASEDRGRRLSARRQGTAERRRALGRYAVHGRTVSGTRGRRLRASRLDRRGRLPVHGMHVICPTRSPASGITAGHSTAGTISPRLSGRVATPGSPLPFPNCSSSFPTSRKRTSVSCRTCSRARSAR